MNRQDTKERICTNQLSRTMQPMRSNPPTSWTQAVALSLAAALLTGVAQAETPRDFLGQYETEAKKSDPAFAVSAARGERFFKAVQKDDWSCATCHSDNPSAIGKHATTSKPIKPLAPAANPERFARAAKVEKWFKRNCNDVLGRACTAAEKGDVLAFLITVKP